MTKDEIQSVVAILLSMPKEDLSKLTTDILIKMHNSITENLRAYHVLVDKVNELEGLLAKAPLAQVKPRNKQRKRN